MATASINRPPGCSHYKRKCKFVTPCCNKTYTCRLCHDKVENHVLDRKGIKEVICLMCNNQQRIQSRCRFCRVKFGTYACMECNLFDDKDKGQFHCMDCGICRVGGSQNYFHCQKCNMCLALRLMGAHECVENRFHENCPVCLEDMHSSRSVLRFLDCGHLLHQLCFKKLKTHGYTACPICMVPFKK